MGNGKRLKAILNEKKMRVSDLARITNMNNKTLYQIISRDSNIRYDFALRIANALDIDISEIYQDNVSTNSEALPEPPKSLRTYAKYRTGDIIEKFDPEEVPDKVDRLLLAFLKLTDEGRQNLLGYADRLLEEKTDKKREKIAKTII